MLIESYALCPVFFLLYFGPCAAGSSIANFFPTLARCSAPFCYARSQPENAYEGQRGSREHPLFHFRSQRKADGNETLTGVDPVGLIESNGETPCELHHEVENSIDEIPS
jgi:hypothetical protein